MSAMPYVRRHVEHNGETREIKENWFLPETKQCRGRSKNWMGKVGRCQNMTKHQSGYCHHHIKQRTTISGKWQEILAQH